MDEDIFDLDIDDIEILDDLTVSELYSDILEQPVLIAAYAKYA